MTYRTMQVASSFGALDVDAIADGASLGAMQARVMARQANRLLKKRHQILNLMWPTPTSTINDLAQYGNESTVGPTPNMMVAPCSVLKKPGITGATAYFRTRAANGMRCALRVGTAAVDQPGLQEVAITGTGSWQWSSVSITLDPGDQERVVVYLLADGPTSGLMNTGFYGSPNSGLIQLGDLVTDSTFELHSVNPSWTDGLVTDGHFFRLLRDDVVVFDRTIVNMHDHGAYHVLVFDSRDGWTGLTNYLNTGTYQGIMSFEIRQLPWLAMAQVLVVTDERAL